MGNHLKRKQLSKLIKEHDFGKLYQGNKKLAWKNLRSYDLDAYIHKLSFKSGDIAGDCDAQQHKIVKWLPYNTKLQSYYTGNKKRKCFNGYTFSVDQFQKEDGSWSCGCPQGPDKKRTRDDLEKEWLESYDQTNILEQKQNGWWTERNEKIYNALKNGIHIFDQDGIILPEYK